MRAKDIIQSLNILIEEQLPVFYGEALELAKAQ